MAIIYLQQQVSFVNRLLEAVSVEVVSQFFRLKKMKKYYLIDHKWLFLFGFIFYLFVPYLVGITSVFKGFPGMELYREFFNKIPKDKIQLYAAITLSWLIAFYLGHFCFKLLQPKKATLQLFNTNSTDYGIASTGILLLFVLGTVRK
jgi:hypothetical protein